MSHLLRSLLALQQFDDQLLDMEQKLREIPTRIRDLEIEFADDSQRLESERKRLKDAVLRQRNLDKQLEEGAEQLKKKELRKFEAKTNEEYSALLKEIEYAKEANSRVEDGILELLDEVEKLEKSILIHEKEIQRKKAGMQSEKKRLEAEVVEIDRSHLETRTRRTELCAGIPADMLGVYENIRTQRSRQAVVVVRGEVCPGCHMHIPPQTINEVLQTGEIRHCPFCWRILYCEILEKTA